MAVWLFGTDARAGKWEACCLAGMAVGLLGTDARTGG